MEANFSPLLYGIGKASLQASILVVAVLAAQALVGSRLSPRWRAGLWMLVVGRLLLPVSFSSTASIYNALPDWSKKPPAIVQITPPATQSSQLVAPTVNYSLAPELPSSAATPMPVSGVVQYHQETSAPPEEPVPATTAKARSSAWTLPSIPSLLLTAWLTGAGAILLYLMTTSFRLKKRLSSLRPVSDPALLGVLESCRRQMGVSRELRVVESDGISTPALHGILHPQLIFPRGFGTAFTQDEMRFVILHELAHVKRHDLALNWVVAVLQAFYWFNPFVWVAFYFWRADRELACDALALEAAGPDRNEAYGRTILRLLRDFTYRSTAPGMVGILEDRRQLSRRIKMIANFKPGKRLGALSVIVAAALGIVCLTDAQVASKTEARADQPAGTNSLAVDEGRETRTGADPQPAQGDTNIFHTLLLTVQSAETGEPVSGAEIEVPYVGDWKEKRPHRFTDAQGRYLLRMPEPSKVFSSRMTHFSVSARSTNYARRTIAWTSSSGYVQSKLPSEATMKLRKGVPLGGQVTDHAGKPIEGVRVLLQGSGYRGFTMGGDQQKEHEYSELGFAKSAPAAITDTQGWWVFKDYPADLATVDVTLVRPDDSTYRFSTGAPGVNNVNNYPQIQLAELLAQKTVFKLPEGITVRGIIVDELGRPVADAVVKEGYGHGNIERVAEFKVSPDGTFERPNRQQRQWIYTVSAAGRATASVVANVAPGMAEVRVVLPPAKPLRVKVVDDRGLPLAGVSLRVDSYKNEGQILDWETKADELGRAVWTNAPTAPVYVYASKPGVQRLFKLPPSDDEHSLVLARSSTEAVVTIKALDAETKKPVAMTGVYKGRNGDVKFEKLGQPMTPEFKATLMQNEWKPGMGTSYKLKVEAEGYEPFETESLEFDLGDHLVECLLRRGGPLAGKAVLSDGSPATGARVWVRSTANAGTLFCNDPGQYYGDRLFKTSVREDGTFEIPAFPTDPPVVITHPNGIYNAKLSVLRAAPRAQLEPFGKVEGRLVVAGKPRARTEVNLTTLVWFPDIGLHLIYRATTDDAGRFSFQQVPPGEYKLFQHAGVRIGPIKEDHPFPIEVQAGQTLKVEYATSGRAVTGQVTAENPDVAIDWQNDDHVLVLKQPALPPLNREDFATFKGFQEAMAQSYLNPARLRQAREARTYVLGFQRDGSFRAEDVPPGTYELRIQATKPLDDPLSRPPEELASLTKEVTVPEGADEFDLGTYNIGVSGAAGTVSRRPSVDLPFKNLDGKTGNVRDLQGKPLVLVIWATWSPRSQEQFPSLKAFAASEDARDCRILDVCLDGEPEQLKRDLKDYRWQHAYVEESSRAQLMSALKVQTVPLVMLLDAEGRVLARDIEKDSLHAALQRVSKGRK